MRALPATFLLLFLGLAPAQANSSDNGTEAGGRLIGLSSDALDLLGDVWVRLPFPFHDRDEWVIDLDTRTSIERADSDLTFDVRDLDYHLEAGWQRRSAGSGRPTLSVFAGQRGKERVDADGQAHARYLGFGIESSGFRHHGPRAPKRRAVEWRLSGGPVVDEREVDADFVLRGSARLRSGWGRGFWRRCGARMVVDGLFDGSDFDADVALGPSLDLAVAGGRRASFFALYQRSRNPLGIGDSALLVGFEYVEGRDGAPLPGAAPEVGGVIGGGSGEDGRHNGQLALRVASPPIADGLYVAFTVDANVVTARDTGDLYYFYHVGVERGADRLRRGVYFYHRSNHQLAEPNDLVTSINVLEAGVETQGWSRPEPRSTARRGRLDGRLRLGYLINSSFGEERRWHARGGLRWAIGPWRRIPFVRIEIETGDVERQSYALGLALGERWEIQAEFRNDQQWFSADRNAWMLVARYGF